MLDNQMQDATMEFIEALKRSASYREYETQLTRIKQQPELYGRVNEFRKKNFVIQNTEDEEKLLDRMDELDQEYEELRTIPLAEDFLKAETSFCRMMQTINMHIVRELDFQ
ncbi:MAG: YlbF family regulator [Lachnospiraceae bacterium]|nr:YlbF family regulator [Lachnospiraceae bacterium]